jgi:hypothetical protein
VDGALHAVFAGPFDHLARRLAVLDAAQADLAQQFDARSRQVAEILFHHAVFDHRRAGKTLTPEGRKFSYQR